MCTDASAADRVIVMIHEVATKPSSTSTKILPRQNGSRSSSIATEPCPCGLSLATRRYIGSIAEQRQRHDQQRRQRRQRAGGQRGDRRAGRPGWRSSPPRSGTSPSTRRAAWRAPRRPPAPPAAPGARSSQRVSRTRRGRRLARTRQAGRDGECGPGPGVLLRPRFRPRDSLQRTHRFRPSAVVAGYGVLTDAGATCRSPCIGDATAPVAGQTLTHDARPPAVAAVGRRDLDVFLAPRPRPRQGVKR